MKATAKSYPDISDILDRKARGRVDLRVRSFGQKLDALDALRDRVAPLRAAKSIQEERHPAPQGAQAPGRAL